MICSRVVFEVSLFFVVSGFISIYFFLHCNILCLVQNGKIGLSKNKKIWAQKWMKLKPKPRIRDGHDPLDFFKESWGSAWSHPFMFYVFIWNCNIFSVRKHCVLMANVMMSFSLQHNSHHVFTSITCQISWSNNHTVWINLWKNKGRTFERN